MQAKFTHESEFRRERDFGAKVGATFEFIAAQFRPLVKCLAYFVLPGTLVFGIGIGLFFNVFMAAMPGVGARRQTAADLTGLGLSSMLGMTIAGLGALVALLLLSSTVYGFVRVRMDTPVAEAVQPAQVWAYIRSRLGRVVLAWLLLSALGTAVMVVVFGVMFALIGTGGGQGGAAVGIVFLLFFPLMWALVCLALYFPVLWMEDTDVWTALRRSFYLVRGKWWSTFGLYFVVAMIQGIINYMFAIPMYGLMVMKMLKIPGLESGVLSIIAASIYALGVVFTSVLPLVAMLFQYFNLVERKEGLGLRLMVDSLGQTPAPQVSNATFRPDDEGEY
jgi:hypothetical protein